MYFVQYNTVHCTIMRLYLQVVCGVCVCVCMCVYICLSQLCLDRNAHNFDTIYAMMQLLCLQCLHLLLVIRIQVRYSTLHHLIYVVVWCEIYKFLRYAINSAQIPRKKICITNHAQPFLRCHGDHFSLVSLPINYTSGFQDSAPEAAGIMDLVKYEWYHR